MSQTGLPAGQRDMPTWPKDAVRIAFGVIWAIDAALKWTPGFRAGYLGYLTSAAKGQPSWLQPWFSFWIHVQHSPVVWA